MPLCENGNVDDEPVLPKGWFASTHWSVVLAAGAASTREAHAALEQLCRTYWYPLYAYIRRRHYSPSDAQDLTQAFFARVLEKNYVGQANPAKGRFRSFLLGALNHFLADEWDRSRAQKRGGGEQHFSVDAALAENRYHVEPTDSNDPQRLYERRWAMTVLEQAAARLRDEYAAQGKLDLFEALRRFESAEESYSESASRLGIPENTLKSHVRRLRLRNRHLVREVIAETVATPADIDDEIRHLMIILSQ